MEEQYNFHLRLPNGPCHRAVIDGIMQE